MLSEVRPLTEKLPPSSPPPPPSSLAINSQLFSFTFGLSPENLLSLFSLAHTGEKRRRRLHVVPFLPLRDVLALSPVPFPPQNKTKFFFVFFFFSKSKKKFACERWKKRLFLPCLDRASTLLPPALFAWFPPPFANRCPLSPFSPSLSTAFPVRGIFRDSGNNLDVLPPPLQLSSAFPPPLPFRCSRLPPTLSSFFWLLFFYERTDVSNGSHLFF